MKNKRDLTNFAATVLESFGLTKACSMNESDKDLLERITEKGKIEKAFLFHADAIPSYVVEKYPDIFAKVRENSTVEIGFNSVMPSITPCCFGAMFSGAYPENNGIPEYAVPILSDELVQPALKVKTLVDVFTENGLKVALVTCANGCIASMLYGRGADMYIIEGDDDKKMFEKAIELFENNEHDVIMLYQLSYDYKMHECGPESGEALNVLAEITDRYAAVCEKARSVWEGKNYLTDFNTDHGCHSNPPEYEKKGDHGKDIPEDMELVWFFGTNKAL